MNSVTSNTRELQSQYEHYLAITPFDVTITHCGEIWLNNTKNDPQNRISNLENLFTDYRM